VKHHILQVLLTLLILDADIFNTYFEYTQCLCWSLRLIRQKPSLTCRTTDKNIFVYFKLCEISDSHGGEYENESLLRYSTCSRDGLLRDYTALYPRRLISSF
jgi:hypothetical protein